MGFILAILFSWPFLVGIALMILVLEHNDATGWTLFTTIALGVLLYFAVPALTLATMGLIAAAWIPVGFVWSYYRWKRYCDTVVKLVRDGSIGPDTGKGRVAIRSNITRITHWIIAWPFSFVESIVGDVIDMIHRAILRIAKSTYAKISDGAIADINRYSETS